MVITVQVSITPLHLWDAELVGTSPLSWEAVWIIQASKKLQYPDLCKILRIKRFRKPTINTSVQNKLNKCICWKDVLSSEETLYITSRYGVYNFLYHTLMFINCRKQFIIENRNMFCMCMCLKFIPLCYIISQLTYALPPTTKNCISLVNTCYTFQSHWPSSGVRYIIFKTGNKMHIRGATRKFWEFNL